MTPSDQDRPTPARRARPAPDEGHDPADLAPPPAATRPAPAPLTPRRSPEPTVQLNTRVSLSVRALVDRAIADSGASLREAVEHAVTQTYGQTYGDR